MTRKRRFQYSLRSLLILVALVACLLAAWQAYVEPYRRQRETMAYIEHLGGEYKTELGGPSWLRGLFGEDNCQNIIEIWFNVNNVSDAEYKANFVREDWKSNKWARLTLERHFNPINVVDADLANFKGLTNLQKLWLVRSDTSESASTRVLLSWLPSRA